MMESIKIPQSRDLVSACKICLDTLETWASDCMQRYRNAPPPSNDGHDQLTYTTSWNPLVKYRDRQGVLGYLKQQRDLVASRFQANGAWWHGYWKRQEAHHGTEHFELFLGNLLQLDPDDAVTIHQLNDAAEHFGNWVPEVPPFFDWDTGLFKSVFLGTEYVGSEPAESINMPDHFRLINIALLLYEATDEQRYLDLALAHISQWAQAIVHHEDLPIGLSPHGAIINFEDTQAGVYRQFADAAAITRVSTITELERVENFVASNSVPTFLQMWRYTDDTLYRKAAENLMDILTTQLHDPDAGVVSSLVRSYRQITNDHRYDAAVLAVADDFSPQEFTQLRIDPTPQATLSRGIGKRRNQPSWFIDEKLRSVSPLLLALAAEIRNDSVLATHAIDLAHAHLQLAIAQFSSGREHGCGARSVSAVARGHGRENNAGIITAVVEPIMQTFEIQQA